MIQVTIDRLGHRGDGVAEGPVFVHRALPGEVVEGLVEGDRMAEPRIVTPSPDRIKPPCPHARNCGGCAVQHWRDDAVAAWKVEIVERALAAQGLEAPPITGPATSPPQSRRRATFAGRRTKSGAMIGFHSARSDQIVDTPHCHLVHPALRDIRPALEALVRVGASRKDSLALTATVLDQGVEVSVTGGKPEPDGLAGVAAEHGLIRLIWQGEVVAQAATPTLDFDGILISPPPGAFLQATRDGETALRQAVIRATEGAAHMADLFAGCGTFALPLARGARVHAVEGAAPLIQALDQAWRQATGLKAVTTETRDLFRRPLLPDELARFDAVVLDPPRAGAAAQCAILAEAGPARIAMVSCNPVSFARDAATLTQAGYRLDWIEVVDQFRWSTHVELSAALSR